MEHETFWTLLKDLPHWEFELFLIGLFDGVIGLFIWPCIQKRLVHHKSDDRKLAQMEEQIQELQQALAIKQAKKDSK